ncbi:MAG: hypothetical protein HY291_11770 [Planctomycetes bacterium]|nr:hypothetical protein [Planctomycetota bacterium]
MADKDGGPAREEKEKPAKSPEKMPERTKAVKAQPQMSFVVRVLLDWSAETHGKLLLMGLSLFFIGGVLTFSSWLVREKDNEFHVWISFFFVGAACLVFGILAWIWKALRRDRKLK